MHLHGAYLSNQSLAFTDQGISWRLTTGTFPGFGGKLDQSSKVPRSHGRTEQFNGIRHAFQSLGWLAEKGIVRPMEKVKNQRTHQVAT